ncbi:RusA family crossover junction endodeoxyribonuclease [Clostridium sporogenes]|uniref:RusA family crossover junction endodeoxyribonuclease n=2 Tax=Clostridium TaxID=1485 RepID=A0A6M0SVZ3_CLOBO|nr:RusA family crossover junction endodeoxyribonuclease [Clostridium sporogenes]NFA59434.1 RusA family crossover junction endodeoxyribonuclease [Clostridium botulinum]MDS1004262.1 RusA family crossover junction endodeoxyribonuclease [Clostridium sporogenes]NFI74618.1 RusA family crossover junction endodeoxyribonuclease [Clostridium sporogenes]NFL71247.1 RusA family crossover junction endodeoxyribonuclease [Clostridium sporogenes]NFM25410.1 RusA family crossover junction endodeoxyribonuclease [
MKKYAKVIIEGSPISKSNFKLFNLQGRAIMPLNSGKYHDRYAVYEEKIAYEARLQNPNTVLEESLIAVLKVYYKSKKRHPDTNNITKSIFDGIEKSGLIINDAQIRRLIIEEFYDKEFPRFELELYAESIFKMEYNIIEKENIDEPINYSPPPNKKVNFNKNKDKSTLTPKDKIICEICGKSINKNDIVTANNKTIILCKNCLTKLF